MSLRQEPKDIFESNKEYVKQILELLIDEKQKIRNSVDPIKTEDHKKNCLDEDFKKLDKEIETYKNLIEDLDKCYKTSFIDYFLDIKDKTFKSYQSYKDAWEDIFLRKKDKSRILKDKNESWAIWYAFSNFEDFLYEWMKEFDIINQPNGEADMLLDRLHELSTRLSGNYAKFSKSQSDSFTKLIKPNLEVIEKKFLEAQEHGESVMQIDSKGNIK